MIAGTTAQWVSALLLGAFHGPFMASSCQRLMLGVQLIADSIIKTILMPNLVHDGPAAQTALSAILFAPCDTRGNRGRS